MKSILIVLFIVSSLFGQDEGLIEDFVRERTVLLWQDSTSSMEAEVEKEPLLTHALQLQYDGNLYFSSFSGKTLSYKYFTSPEMEIRYSISIDGQWRNPDSETTNETDTSNAVSWVSATDIWGLSGSFGYYRLKHNYNTENISAFWG